LLPANGQMKKYLLVAGFLALAGNGFAQVPAGCDSIGVLMQKNRSQASACVLSASEYILARSLAAKNDTVDACSGMIYYWIDRSTDYSITLNPKVIAVCNGGKNVALMQVYCACLAKAALVGKEKNYKKEGFRLFVDYVKNPANKVGQTEAVQQMLKDAKTSRKLEYIDAL